MWSVARWCSSWRPRPAHRYATARPRRAARSRFPIAEWSPQKRKCVTQITDGRDAASYIDDNRTHTLEEGEHVMTWTSDRAGVVLYTVLGMRIVLASIYIPACGVHPEQRPQQP